MGNQLIDCHAHLDEFGDIAGVLRRADKSGVKAIIGVGVNISSSQRILEIARNHQAPKVFPAVGLYPDEVTEEGIKEILNLIRENHPGLVAIGEIGLDYWIKPLRKKQPGREEKKALQQKAFRIQLELANKYSLVPIVHSRGAWKDCYRLVKEAGIAHAVFHWYSGPLDVLEGILGAGYHISATPAAAYSPQHREALEMTPLEKIILETDCPVPRREGEDRLPTGPADVFYSLKAVSELKNTTEAEVARITNQAASRLFSLDRITP